jgi:hypothetical protein
MRAIAVSLGLALLWGQTCACGARCFPPSPPSVWPVAVYAHAFGTSQTFGQSSQYFPYNVLGEICTSATPTSPCADPCQVVSLGKGGYIVLTFDPPIADGPGADFIVFENAFYYGSGQVFDEWMIVKVSQDGQVWYTFPYDPVTGQGLAGRTPTGCQGCPTGTTNWQNPTEAGGDAFDLSDAGLPWARYVRVEDATHFQTPDRLSADLDGIVAIHQLPASSLYTSAPSDTGEILGCWDYLGRAIESDLFTLPASTPCICLVRTKAGGLFYRRLVKMGGE